MGFETFQADLTNPGTHDPEFWRGHLREVDFVVIAAGLLTGSARAFEAVHELAPKAIYAAMKQGSRAVLISAVGLEADTPFAHFRRRGEAIANEAPVDATILRPGLVLADTSYGGSSLLRALAALPFVTPVIGRGDQRFNPLHVDDLAKVVRAVLHSRKPLGTLEVGGPETVTLTDVLASYRRWLGLPKSRLLSIPPGIALMIGKAGDALALGPVSATSVNQLATGIGANTEALEKELSPNLRPISEFISTRPAATQDLWQARLYLLRPLLRLGLGVMWLVSGLLGLLLPLSHWSAAFAASGLSETSLMLLAKTGGVLDLTLALALFRAWHPTLTGVLQLSVVGIYTLALTFLAPVLRLDPFGGLLKNIPVLLLILVWMVLEEER